jgi:hypothetical protein
MGAGIQLPLEIDFEKWMGKRTTARNVLKNTEKG